MSFVVHAMEDDCGFNDCVVVPFVKCKSEAGVSYLRYDYGFEIEKSSSKCFVCIKQLNNMTGLSDEEICRLCVCYLNKWGVSFNEDEEISYLERAANLGCSDAMLELGLIYSRNEDTIERAIFFLEKVEKLRNSDAMLELGLIYSRNEDTIGKAISYLEKAANLGCTDAMLELGLIYSRNEDTIGKAISCFERAANLGCTDEMFKLGLIYSRNEDTIEQAILSYAYVAAGHDYRGMYNLGLIYQKKGEIEEARKWIYYSLRYGSKEKAPKWLGKNGYPTNVHNMPLLMDAVKAILYSSNS